MWNAFTAGKRSTGAIQRGNRLRHDLLVIHRSGSEGARERFDHHFEQTSHRVYLFIGQQIEKRVRSLTFLFGVGLQCLFLSADGNREPPSGLHLPFIIP